MIGAGPQGLGAVAHLRGAGVDAYCFGETMAFWERHMPPGMLLRSTRRSSHISSPGRELGLERFEAEHGVRLSVPIKLEEFLRYGRWFQSRAVPDLDSRRVTRLTRRDDHFILETDDGESLVARRVVVAAGIEPFAWQPQPFRSLPPELVSHSLDYGDLGRLRGKGVIVVGAGQSALESAALLHEAGASVEVVARTPMIRWLPPEVHGNGARARLHRLMYPPTDVGPRGYNYVAAAPDVYRRLPVGLRAETERRCLLPAGAAWLRPRLVDVPVTTGSAVARAVARDGGVQLTLDDGSVRSAEHVLLATGYRVDVSRYDFLSPDLLPLLRTVGGYPLLSEGFESSVPRLHFLGAVAGATFGPVMRFVTGSSYAARALTRHVLGRPPAALDFSW